MEEIIQYSTTFARQVQTSWNHAHAPLLVDSIPKTPRTQSEASWFSGSQNYKTKQNKTNYLPSQIDLLPTNKISSTTTINQFGLPNSMLIQAITKIPKIHMMNATMPSEPSPISVESGLFCSNPKKFKRTMII